MNPPVPQAVRLLLLAVLVLLGVPSTGNAQLISPGKLTEAHANLEGIRQCTQCHEARRRGVQQDLCLSCHQPLNARIASKQGFHAALPELACGTCHKEHAGRDADVVRFDQNSFEHERDAGFALAGAHVEEDCSSCHNRDLVTDPATRRFKAAGLALDKTYLGLGTTCLACHAGVDPHRDQFDDRGCQDCHTESEWEGAVGFDHDDARFRLEGKHASVACVGCHTEQPPAAEGQATFVRFKPVGFATCESCHGDNHDGQMGACTDCHTPAGWSQIPRSKFEEAFDHSSTDYALEGAHLQLGCMTCHKGEGVSAQIAIDYGERNRTPSYPSPRVETGCMSCHLDYHQGDVVGLADGADCTSCHSVDGWMPSSFDLFRHNSETQFELAGAHAAVPCASCHEPAEGIAKPVAAEAAPRVTFHISASECASCHLEDSPHDNQFDGRACETCHTSDEVFLIASFDHEGTAFPLTGSHENVACLSCHPTEPGPDGLLRVRYRPLEVECAACHSEVR